MAWPEQTTNTDLVQRHRKPPDTSVSIYLSLPSPLSQTTYVSSTIAASSDAPANSAAAVAILSALLNLVLTLGRALTLFASRLLGQNPWSSLFTYFFLLPLRMLTLLFTPLVYLAAFLGAFLRVLFAPALHVLNSLLAFTGVIVVLIAAFQPLYIFFSVAAGIGIITGITAGACSSLITTWLGMCNDPALPDRRPSRNDSHARSKQPISAMAELKPQDAKIFWPESSFSRHLPSSSLLTQTIHEEDDSDL